ncbi:MAG: hypothetical protein CTY12_00240 [Methylotenera sp.]|nr:MAG: hypothetical protein CTY12_00240 [Methylotenera sp.]
MTKLRKAAAFTDIHWGAKNNSDQHNQDCLNYIDWLCDQVKSSDVDHIIFMGDWYEVRSAINISTLTFSHEGARRLNQLNIPVFFLIGNHDLYYRHSRDIYSTITFSEFSNFTIIHEPTIINEIETNPLLCPYLFNHEYPSLVQYNNVKTWWGHFEFKGFIVTGYNITMQSGPDHTSFDGPTFIFSGHFHKRQYGGNVVYIGNTFPTNFSDADDAARGMMIYDHISEDITFLDWEDCPKYIKTTLSKLLDGDTDLPKYSRVQCIVDIPITFEECAIIRQTFTDQFELREFITEESKEIATAITDTEFDNIEQVNETSMSSVDELVIHMLNSINTEHIDNDLLVQIYKRLG